MGTADDSGASRLSADADFTEVTLRTIMRGTRFIRQIMEPFFSGFGIRTSQWVVMRIIRRREDETGSPIRLVDLSGILLIRQPTLTAIINQLVLMGLVERTSSESDRRGRMVTLSPQGRELMDRIMELHRSMVIELFSVWGPEDKEKIIELFERLEDHLLKYIPMDSGKGKRFFPDKSKSARGEL